LKLALLWRNVNLFQIHVIFKITNWLQQNGATHYSINCILQFLYDFYWGGGRVLVALWFLMGVGVESFLNTLCSVGWKMSVDSKTERNFTGMLTSGSTEFCLCRVCELWRHHLKHCLKLSFFRPVFKKKKKATISFIMSACLSTHPHGTYWLPVDGFSWHLIFECFSKICQQSSGFFKIW
jgi:hypothetical protein